MNTWKLLITFLFITFYSFCARSQGIILSVSPDKVSAGDEEEMVVRGAGTHFRKGQTSVSLGPGITINTQSIVVPDQETLLFRFRADNTAAGVHDLLVTTGKEQLIKPAALTISGQPSSFNAAFTLYPVRYLTFSYFNSRLYQGAPEIFDLTIHNDNSPHQLTLLLIVSPTDYGTDPIIVGKKIINILPSAVLTVDNKQFDYQIKNTAGDLFQEAGRTGSIPADLLHFQMQVFEGGNLLSISRASIQLTNPMDRVELIYPGSSFSLEPEQIQTLQPLFQWYSQGSSFNLAIYPVLEGQSTPEEVVLNRPVHVEKDIQQTHYLYPAGAALLEEGKLYAWQITAVSYGQPPLPGEVKWFRVISTSTPVKSSRLAEVKIIPEDAILKPGEQIRFRLAAFNATGDSLAVKPLWKIIPYDAGTIDANGNFTAGDHNVPAAAIIANCGGYTDYVTVEIKSPAQEGKPEEEKK